MNNVLSKSIYLKLGNRNLNKKCFIPNNYITITFMMKLKKSVISMIVLRFTSLILIPGSPFQIASNLVENNGHLNYKNIGQETYGADDDGGGDSDSGDGDGEVPLLLKIESRFELNISNV